MFRTRARRALFILGGFALLFLSSCAQSQAVEADVDLEALKSRLIEYLGSLYPNLSEVTVEELRREEGSPFYLAELLLKSGQRQQKSEVRITSDGKYLVLGQVWDLSVDPSVARWNQKKEGSEERLAKVDLTDRPFQGNPDASVVIVEFSDYQCPYCSRAYENLEEQILANYGDRVKLVFKHLPLENLHPWAKPASIAAACAYVQEPPLFWELHSRLFRNQKSITVQNLREKLATFADEIQLDKEAFLSCFDEQRTKSVVEADMSEAQLLGLRSTPTFLINGAVIAGAVPLEEMSTYIDLALQDAAVAQP